MLSWSNPPSPPDRKVWWVFSWPFDTSYKSPRAHRQADHLVVQGYVKKYKIPIFQPRWNFGIANWNFGTTEKTYNFLEFSGLYVRLYIEIPKSWNRLSPCQSRKKHHLFQNSSWNNWNANLTEILSHLVRPSKCNASHGFYEVWQKMRAIRVCKGKHLNPQPL